MADTVLNKSQLREELKFLKFWKVEDKQLVREIELRGFQEAVQFVTLVANAAEEMNHHPDVQIFRYNRARISVTTHKAGGITGKDIEMARRVNRLHAHLESSNE